MKHWTASINLYEHGEDLRYSICWFRVSDLHARFGRPTRRVTGVIPAPSQDSPEEWLQAALAALLKR